MPNTATVTGKTSAGSTVTALVLDNVTNIKFDFDHQVVTFSYGLNPPRKFELDYATTVTVTLTIASGVTTATLST